ncbi:MAG: hypothetical protein MK135_09560, partial [Polyangiaceae bacterium]|nr:hypothetical protein [Polyangiaceae bacterium]
MAFQGLEKDAAIAAGELVGILFAGWLLSHLIGRLVLLIMGGSQEGPSPLATRIRRMIAKTGALFTFLTAFGVTALNGWLLFTHRGVWSTQVEFLQRISPEARQALLVAVLKVGAGAWLCSFLLGWVGKGLAWGREWLKSQEWSSNQESVDRLTYSLTRIIERVTWLAFAWYGAKTIGVPESVVGLLLTAIKVYAIIALGLLLWRALDVVIETLQQLSERIKNEYVWMSYYDRLQFLVPLARRSLEYIIYFSFASMAMQQVDFISGVALWGPRAVRVIGYFFIARVAVAVVTLTIDELASRKAKTDLESNQRLLPLVPLCQSILKYAIYFAVSVAILGAVGVDPG